MWSVYFCMREITSRDMSYLSESSDSIVEIVPPSKRRLIDPMPSVDSTVVRYLPIGENRRKINLWAAQQFAYLMYRESTNKLHDCDRCPTYYTSVNAPTISLDDYVKRFVTYAGSTADTLMIAYIYIHRIVDGPKSLEQLTDRTVHRLIAGALRIAQKFHIDGYHLTNSTYSKVAGVNDSDMLRIEHFTVRYGLQWSSYFTTEEYEKAKNEFNNPSCFKLDQKVFCSVY